LGLTILTFQAPISISWQIIWLHGSLSQLPIVPCQVWYGGFGPIVTDVRSNVWEGKEFSRTCSTYQGIVLLVTCEIFRNYQFISSTGCLCKWTIISASLVYSNLIGVG